MVSMPPCCSLFSLKPNSDSRAEHPFSYCDLVLPLDLPDDLQLPTDHYDDARFFTYVEHIRNIVDDHIFVAGSRYPDEPGSFYVSNVYAYFEVAHWPGVEDQIIWTAWVIGVILNWSNGTPIPWLPPRLRGMYRKWLRDEKLDRQEWLFIHLPALRDQGFCKYMLSRAARKPCGRVVLENEEEYGIKVVAAEEVDQLLSTAQPDERYDDFVLENSCFQGPVGHVRTLLSFVRNPRELPGRFTDDSSARLTFNEEGLFVAGDTEHEVSRLTMITTADLRLLKTAVMVTVTTAVVLQTSVKPVPRKAQTINIDVADVSERRATPQLAARVVLVSDWSILTVRTIRLAAMASLR